MAQGREAWLLSLEEEREKELSCRKLGEGTSRPSSKPKEAPPHLPYPPIPPHPHHSILVEFARGLAQDV